MNKTELTNGSVVVSCELSSGMHDIAADMIKDNMKRFGNYTLEEVDTEMANVWIADAHSEGNEEYAEFLRKAIAESAELYTLTDHLGDFSQSLGEIAVFYN